MRFLLSRRWALFAVTVVLLTYGAYLLGQWQFHRQTDRASTNDVTAQNLRADPVPVDDVLAVSEPVAASEVWRRVTATGTYQAADSLVVRYQTRDGASGVDIVTPLRTVHGPTLLVDRGWMATENRGTDEVDAPPPPAGEVTVVGWVRADAKGDSTRVSDGSARAISSEAIGETLDGEVYGGFVDLEKEDPAPATALTPAERPDLGGGPHFFYGLQWWFFGALAVFGFFYLAYDERRKLRAPTGAAGSESPEHPAVDREHRTADEARSR